MAEDLDSSPIIIKKKKADHSHHGGAWKVAYADFVTAMMALFIVLWILNQDDAVKESVAKYFKDPIGFSQKGKNFIEENSFAIPQNIDSVVQAKQRESEKKELKSMGDKILSELSSNPNFSKLAGQIKVEIVDEGLRIEMLDSSEVFFKIGTSSLKPEAVNLLKIIGNELSKLPNKIVIEGHTDSRPYSGGNKGYTNFELSADRANSARRALLQGEMKMNHIAEIRGYADRKLRDKKDPYNLVNRRISIIVKFTK